MGFNSVFKGLIYFKYKNTAVMAQICILTTRRE